jgi:hypothetical protein
MMGLHNRDQGQPALGFSIVTFSWMRKSIALGKKAHPGPGELR